MANKKSHSLSTPFTNALLFTYIFIVDQFDNLIFSNISITSNSVSIHLKHTSVVIPVLNYICTTQKQEVGFVCFLSHLLIAFTIFITDPSKFTNKKGTFQKL